MRDVTRDAARRDLRHTPRRRCAAARLAPLAALLSVFTLLVACTPLDPFRPAHGNRLDDAHQILRPLMLDEGGGVMDTFDPAFALSGADYNLVQAIFPPLVTLDAHLDVVPWAATALPDVSADGTAYTFHLHPGMKWSDGTAIDAATYAYSINRALDRCTNASA